VPVSVYIIGRTSGSFFNVLFYKYYVKKYIPLLYYFGLIFLVVAYILLGINYTTFATNIETKFSVIFLFFTGFTSSLYNNMVEKHLDDYTKASEENKEIANDQSIKYSKMEIQLFYQIIANIYGFIFVLPVAIGFCVAPIIRSETNLFQTMFLPNFLFVITGISYQIYFLFKILLLGHTQIAGNQVVSGIDLSRRVMINIIAYIALQEYYNLEIIIANICMFSGSLLFVLGQLNLSQYNYLTRTKMLAPMRLENITHEDVEEIEHQILINDVDQL